MPIELYHMPSTDRPVLSSVLTAPRPPEEGRKLSSLYLSERARVLVGRPEWLGARGRRGRCGARPPASWCLRPPPTPAR